MSCPVVGCGKQIRIGYLMCSKHWFSLPRDLRIGVLDSWRAWNRAPHEPLTTYLDLRKAYQRNRDAAIAHVNQQVAPVRDAGE